MFGLDSQLAQLSDGTTLAVVLALAALLLAGIPNHALAAAALAVFAIGTAISMALLSTGFGLTIGTGVARRSLARVAPVLGVASLAFGVWYTLGALAVAPYPL